MRKFILITIIIIAGAFVIFNFWAAHQAEQRVDKDIQTWADSLDYTIQYSSINVRPFAGNIRFNDLTIIGEAHIERARKMIIDLRYIDFLDMYFGGIKYGLKNVLSGNVDFKKFSWISRQTTRQISFGGLKMDYQGQFWDGFQHLLADRPLRHTQKITINGTAFGYRKTPATLGDFKSDSVYASLNWPEAKAGSRPQNDSVRFDHTTWIPPADFQQKYAFFIKGFGFKKDSIAISTAGFSSTSANSHQFNINNGRLSTKLFTVDFHGSVLRDSSWSGARLAPMNISIRDFSPKFKDVLTNIQKLMGKKIPSLKNNIHFRLAGPLNSPHVVQPDTTEGF